jgi:hypothetical protein
MADFLENDQKWAREERKQIKCISLVCTVHTHDFILFSFLLQWRRTPRIRAKLPRDSTSSGLVDIYIVYTLIHKMATCPRTRNTRNEDVLIASSSESII